MHWAPSNEAVQAQQIFSDLVMGSVPVIVSNYETAELVRELATASITTKISFINELATLCEHINANGRRRASRFLHFDRTRKLLKLPFILDTKKFQARPVIRKYGLNLL